MGNVTLTNALVNVWVNAKHSKNILHLPEEGHG
jgi:hypothetical protein